MSKTKKKVSIAMIFLVLLIFSGSMIFATTANAAGAPPAILGGDKLIGSTMIDNYTKLLLPVAQITKKTASSTQSATYSFDKAFDNNSGTNWQAVWTNSPENVDFDF